MAFLAVTAGAIVVGHNICRNTLFPTNSSHQQNPMERDKAIKSFTENIKANKDKLNAKQLRELIELFELSMNNKFDIGSWFIDQYESKFLEQQSNISSLNEFVETLKFPKNLLLNYFDIHSSIYKSLSKTTKCKINHEMYNKKIIISYIKCLNDNIHKLYKSEVDSVQFNIKIVPDQLKSLLSLDDNDIVYKNDNNNDDIFTMLIDIISCMDFNFYNQIYIVRGNKNNTNNDKIYLIKKPKPINNDLCKYDGLIHKINSVPKFNGILTFSYHLSQNFDQRHLFYGEVGTRFDQKNLLKVMNLLFDNAENYKNDDTKDDDTKDDEREEWKYEISTEKVSDKIIYIPKNYTQKAINDGYFLQHFDSDKQLFYVLRWRCSMHAVDGYLKRYGFKDGEEIVIYCTNLTTKIDKRLAYVIGVENDKPATNKKAKGIEKWKMDQYFMTAHEIKVKYGIKDEDLPPCSKGKLQQRFDENIDLKKLIEIKNKLAITSYTHLSVIKTNKNKEKKINNKVYTYWISKEDLFDCIQKSQQFRPIISFNENKSKYFIDMVLLINVGNNNWVGIIFGDHENKGNYHPIGLAVDCIDIRNKMALFETNIKIDNDDCKWLNNKICKLDIMSDNENNEIKRLQNIVRQQQLVIDDLNQRLKQQTSINDELKEQNNHYFQQCLDPNSNIRPHSVHAKATNMPPITIYVNNNNYYHIPNSFNGNNTQHQPH